MPWQLPVKAAGLQKRRKSIETSTKKFSPMRSTLTTALTLGAAFSKSEVIYRQIAVSERLPRNNASKRDEPATNLLLIDFDQSD